MNSKIATKKFKRYTRKLYKWSKDFTHAVERLFKDNDLEFNINALPSVPEPDPAMSEPDFEKEDEEVSEETPSEGDEKVSEETPSEGDDHQSSDEKESESQPES